MMCGRGVSQDLFPVRTRFGRAVRSHILRRHILVRFRVLQRAG